MGDDTLDRKDRYFHSPEREDGPDTVRILPDDTLGEEWRIEKHPVQPVQRGTLYSPVPPANPTKPAPVIEEDEAEFDSSSNGSKAMQPYTGQTRQPAVRNTALANQGKTEPASANTTQIRKGPSACSIIAATVSVLLLSCALLTFATFKSGWDGLGKVFNIFPGIMTTPTVTIDTSRPTVIDQVRPLGKLESIHYQLEKVVTGKSSGPLPDFLTSDKILLVAHGEVVAGVDMSKITTKDIVVISDTVTIRLPKAEVLYSKLDNDKTYVYDRQTGVFSRPDPNLETQIRQAAEQEILKTALEDGILTKAGENAQDVLRTLLTGLGYKEVRFLQAP